MVKYIKSRIVIDSSENTHKKLKNIPRGETFSHFGHEWIVLEHYKTGHTLVLTKNIIGKMPFDESNSNNWANSTLLKYLNCEFLKEMCQGLYPSNLGFFLLTTNLISDDGLKDYGESRDFVSLMTCDLYRKHRDIIEPVDEWWWLATPYSTLDNYSYNVRDVYTDGTLGNHIAHNKNGGVRPICCLSSDIFV